MRAGDATTLRQVSLAALLGLDARLLLTTDDPATHVVYRRAIEQARVWWIERNRIENRNVAVAVVNAIGEAFGRKK